MRCLAHPMKRRGSCSKSLGEFKILPPLFSPLVSNSFHSFHFSSFRMVSNLKPSSFSPRKGCGLASLCPNASPEALSLMSMMLAYNPEQRCTARQALKHPFFREQRESERQLRLVSSQPLNNAPSPTSISPSLASTPKSLLQSQPQLQVPVSARRDGRVAQSSHSSTVSLNSHAAASGTLLSTQTLTLDVARRTDSSSSSARPPHQPHHASSHATTTTSTSSSSTAHHNLPQHSVAHAAAASSSHISVPNAARVANATPSLVPLSIPAKRTSKHAPQIDDKRKQVARRAHQLLPALSHSEEPNTVDSTTSPPDLTISASNISHSSSSIANANISSIASSASSISLLKPKDARERHILKLAQPIHASSVDEQRQIRRTRTHNVAALSQSLSPLVNVTSLTAAQATAAE